MGDAIVKGINVHGATLNWIEDLNKALRGVDKAASVLSAISKLLSIANKFVGRKHSAIETAYTLIDESISNLWRNYLESGDIYLGTFINFEDFWANADQLETLFREKQLNRARVSRLKELLKRRSTVFDVAAFANTKTAPPWREPGDLIGVLGLVFTNPDPIKLLEGVMDFLAMLPDLYKLPPIHSVPMHTAANTSRRNTNDVKLIWIDPIVTDTPFASLKPPDLKHGTRIEVLDPQSKGEGWVTLDTLEPGVLSYTHVDGGKDEVSRIYRIGYMRSDTDPPLKWTMVEWRRLLPDGAPVPAFMSPEGGVTLSDGWKANDWYVAHHVLGLIPGLDDAVRNVLEWTGQSAKELAGDLGAVSSLLDAMVARGTAINDTLIKVTGYVASLLTALRDALSNVEGYVVYHATDKGMETTFNELRDKYYEVRSLSGEDVSEPQYQLGLFAVSGVDIGVGILEQWSQLLSAS